VYAEEGTPNQLTIAGSRSDEDRSAERDALDREFLRRTEVLPPLEDHFPISIVDLFAGCGGLTIGALEGARRAGRGAFLALAVDQQEAFLSVLKATLGGPDSKYQTKDLETLLGEVMSDVAPSEMEFFATAGERSILLAGPPCQGHSALNNHTRHDDPRNDLYLAVARAAEIIQPRAVIIENVRGIGSDRRAAMSRCVDALRDLDYEVDARRLDLHQLGVAQRRVRHVVVATCDEPFEWNLQTAPGRTVGWAVDDLLDPDGSTSFNTPAVPSAENKRRIDYLFDKSKDNNLPNEERPMCHRSDHSYKSMYGRLSWDAPAQTITSGFASMGQGRYVHPKRRRTLTPHEAARLQFLPDFMAFDQVELKRSELATTIGNVAPPLLAAAIVEALITQGLLD
jgi:DNA (cytosine-5)-methyltransferase 1